MLLCMHTLVCVMRDCLVWGGHVEVCKLWVFALSVSHNFDSDTSKLVTMPISYDLISHYSIHEIEIPF